MDLSIASLKAAGAFIAPPVKKEVTWHANGVAQTATVYVLQESFISLTQRWDAQDRGGDGRRDIYGAFWAESTCLILRHKDAPQPR